MHTREFHICVNSSTWSHYNYRFPHTHFLYFSVFCYPQQDLLKRLHKSRKSKFVSFSVHRRVKPPMKQKEQKNYFQFRPQNNTGKKCSILCLCHHPALKNRMRHWKEMAQMNFGNFASSPFCCGMLCRGHENGLLFITLCDISRDIQMFFPGSFDFVKGQE